jgi:hypothetical protein
MHKGTRGCKTFAPDVLADIMARLPPDVLAEILTRLLPNNRRWLCLVCQHWRHIADRRTVTDMRNRTKTLVVAKKKWPPTFLTICQHEATGTYGLVSTLTSTKA